MNMSASIISPGLINKITAEIAWHYRIIPHKKENTYLYLYTDSGKEIAELTEEIEIITNCVVIITKAETRIIQQALEKYYPNISKDDRQQVSYFDGKSEDFLLHIIQEASKLKSSDIHIESYENKCRVRFRIDGQLVNRYLIQKNDYPSLINRIKILANLDIAEKRLPQDGRILFTSTNSKHDIRVSVLPTLHAEKIVLRILGNNSEEINLTDLGFSEADLVQYLEIIKKPTGIILLSGPTGSGKTTTLYATLRVLNKENKNILTIEDPIEYTLEGVNQVQLKESIGLTFASSLKTFLRQDPDIIMVGEIRDQETANMAIRAALTGHLVLSTIHTNSAWGIISRLLDMGIPPYLLATTINIGIAQRLVRLLCPSCKQEQNFNESEYPKGFKPAEVIKSHFIAQGCNKCYNTGYKGRKGIYEVIVIDHELSELIKVGNADVTELLKKKNVKSLADNALELFKSGQTSIDEIYPILMHQ